MTTAISTPYGLFFSVCPVCQSYNTKLEYHSDEFTGHMKCLGCNRIWELYEYNHEKLEICFWREVADTYYGRIPVLNACFDGEERRYEIKCKTDYSMFIQQWVERKQRSH